jgi:type VI secretion system protein ImpF
VGELTPSEKLQPSLLDRLTDEERSSRVEGRDKRVMSMKQLRSAVLRDLSWLLNTSAAPASDEVYEFPLASGSVVNFGLPDATGMSSSGLSLGEMESRMRRAIERFEPRIVTRTLNVRVDLNEGNQRSPSVIGFEISGEFCPLPVPEALFVKTEMDLETGSFEVGKGG